MHILALLALLLLPVPLSAQAPDSVRLDSLRAELVRSRAFIRGAETQITKTLELLGRLGAAPAAVPAPAVPVPPPVDTGTPPPAPATDSSTLAFLLGPQAAPGSHPWPFFDTLAREQLLRHGRAFPTGAVSEDYTTALKSTGVAVDLNYYDLALGLYTEHYRTGDPEMLELARKVADEWWAVVQYHNLKFNGLTPRNMSYFGLMLRALDGRSEFWPSITERVRSQYRTWVGLPARNPAAYPGLYLGVRDGGSMLHYVVWLARLHPDSAVRAEMRGLADEAVHRYYLKWQREDGGWYWTDSGVEAGKREFAAPFHAGLLLDALADYHRLTGDPAVAAAIPRAVDWMWRYYRKDEPVPVPTQASPATWTLKWRSIPYIVYPDGTWDAARTLSGGWDTNIVRETRQNNADIVASFGYAYLLTGDPKYREQGDEVFAATFGKGHGPGADASYCLCDYNAKSLNQALRSAGHYLGWRLSRK